MTTSADLVLRFIAYDLATDIAAMVGDAVENLADRILAQSGTIARGFQDMGIAMMKVGALSSLFGVSLVTGIVLAARAAGDFESQLVLLHTQAGLTGDAAMSLSQKMDMFREGILQMAPGVGFGPVDLAQALYQFVSAATPGVNALDALHAAAIGAAVGHANLSTTAFNLSHVLAAYPKLLPIDAMGQLNAIVGAGTLRMDDLNAAFKGGILATAQLAGISLPQLGGALDTMTDLGIPAANSATYLRQALSAIIAPTKLAQSILSGVGLTGDEVKTSIAGMADMLKSAGITQSKLGEDLRQGGLIQAFDDLRSHMTNAGISAQAQADIIIRAFGGARMGTAMAVMYENQSRLVSKTAQVTAGTHELAQQFDYMVDHDPNFDLQMLHATFQTLVTVLGEAFLPVLVRLLPPIMQVTLLVTNWVSANRDLVAHIIEGAAAFFLIFGAINMVGGAILFASGTVLRLLGPIGILTGGLGRLFSLTGMGARGLAVAASYLRNFGLAAFTLIPGVAQLGAILGGLGGIALRVVGSLIALPRLFMAVGGVLRLLPGLALFAGRGFLLMATQFGAIPVILTGLRMGLVALATGGFGVLRAGIMALVTGGLPALLGGLGTIAAAVGPFLLLFAAVAAAATIAAVLIHDNWGRVGSTFDSFRNTVTVAFKEAIAVWNATHSPLQVLTAILRNLGVGMNVIDGIIMVIVRVMDMFHVTINGAVSVVRRFFSELTHNLGQIHGMHDALSSLSKAWQFLGPIIGVVAGIILSILGGAFQGLLSALAVAIPAAIQIAIDIITILGGVFQVLGALVVGVVKIVNDIIHGNWSQAWKDAQQMVGNMASGVGTIFHGLVNLVVDLITGLWHTVVALFTGFVSGVIGAAENLYHTLVGGSIFPDMVNQIIAWVNRLPGTILGILEGLVVSAASTSTRIGQAIFSGITGALGNLGGAISNQVSGALGSVGGQLHNLGIPGFASGGVVMHPTLAMVGEAGPELIVPLSAISGGSSIAPYAPAFSGGAAPQAAPTMDQHRMVEALEGILQVLVEMRDNQKKTWKGSNGQGGSTGPAVATNSAIQQIASLLYSLQAKGSMQRNALGMRAEWGI